MYACCISVFDHAAGEQHLIRERDERERNSTRIHDENVYYIFLSSIDVEMYRCIDV
jgi:hypothetical protein